MIKPTAGRVLLSAYKFPRPKPATASSFVEVVSSCHQNKSQISTKQFSASSTFAPESFRSIHLKLSTPKHLNNNNNNNHQFIKSRTFFTTAIMSSSSSSASETSTNTTEVAEIIDSNANTTTSTRKKSMVYTKTGDKGTTGLFNGERRYKDEVFFEALGTTDELNANIGMAREYCINIPEIVSKLDEIQSRLLDIGSAIATPKSSPASTQKRLEAVRFDEKHIETLEEWIDALDAQLPPLTNFILPSGGIASSQLHIARTVCRRAERQIVSLEREGHVDIAVLKYMNRLSDFLFVAARYAAKAAGKEEVVYKKSLGVIKRQ